jgi:hypothetical protein
LGCLQRVMRGCSDFAPQKQGKWAGCRDVQIQPRPDGFERRHGGECLYHLDGELPLGTCVKTQQGLRDVCFCDSLKINAEVHKESAPPTSVIVP